MPKKMYGDYYEHGFTAKSEVPGLEYGEEAKPSYLPGNESSPTFKKVKYESEGEGSASAAK